MIPSFFHSLVDRIPRKFSEASREFWRLIVARRIRHAGGIWSPIDSELATARNAVADVLAKSRAWAALHSARLLNARIEKFSEESKPLTVGVFYSLPFLDAVTAWLNKHPDVFLDLGAVYEQFVNRGGEMVDAMQAEMEALIDRRIFNAISTGESLTDFRERMAANHGEPQAYWETVYRTNVAQAYSDGQRSQAARLDGVVGFKRYITRDRVTRPNHRAAGGLCYGKLDPRADWYAIPWGHNCRCWDAPVTIAMAKRMGLVIDSNGSLVVDPWPSDARPDIGFK